VRRAPSRPRGGDGVIDINDAVWGALVLWTDRDLDGQTDAGELVPASSRVASIALDYVTESHRQVASFETTGGVMLPAVDVWLASLWPAPLPPISSQGLSNPADADSDATVPSGTFEIADSAAEG
jgi:hypothetical protein